MKQVVIIDDDDDDAEILCECIQTFDDSVVCSSFLIPDEAVNKISQPKMHPPDYIFIDSNMPKMKGEQCLTELKKLPKLGNTRFISFSTSMPAEAASKFMSLGVHATFEKPTNLDRYVAILKKIFNGGGIL
jgi:CheY-like chemotaxis protein